MPASAITRVSTSRPLLTLKWGKLRAFQRGSLSELESLDRQLALHCICGEMDASEPMARACIAGLVRGHSLLPMARMLLNLAVVVLDLDRSQADYGARI